jgi:anhydro-N-acetylmuramic acid kinase
MNNKYKVIGLMSGTSLDGLDIACCTFQESENGWTYQLDKAESIRYPKKIAQSLSGAQNLSSVDLMALDASYGQVLGTVSREFLKKNKLNVDFIASHGHTIFHQPEKRFTLQIGNGNVIHAITQVPVIYDFRSLDVALGGQGAPLVPIGDKLLFPEYDFCLNIGGIANVSMDRNGKRVAFDICFANMGFNYLMNQRGKLFDKGGEKAASGVVDQAMLKQLLKVYSTLRKKRPSLGREIFEQKIKPAIDVKKVPIENKLATLVEAAAIEIVGSLELGDKPYSMLCTGGGVYNSFLMSRILNYGGDNLEIIIPEDDVVKFKEALIFAFLGVLRFNRKINCFKDVTGASRDSSSGVMVGF